MIAKGNHYSSRLAAQKARAAFRLTAKTSGTPTDAYGIKIAKARFLPVFAKQSCIHAL